MNLVLIWTALFILATAPIFGRFGLWCWYVFLKQRPKKQDRVAWSDVTVRILTVGTYEETVQKTVDAIKNTDADVQVVSEQQLTIDGASVHVVDESFECDATNKGRALEWARRTLPKRDYVLLLDEDSVLDSAKPPVKGDLVQLRQNPVRTGSILSLFAEFQRVGVGEETYSFNPSNPEYVWGGGLLFAAEVEDAVTWNRHSLQEDGVFVRSAIEAGYKYHVARRPQVCNNAPPTFQAIVEQRRRWNSSQKPFLARLKENIGVRGGIVWILNTFLPILMLLALVVNAQPLYALLLPAYGINVIWTLFGIYHANGNLGYYLLTPILTPLASFYNGFGNLYALIRPAETFEVTEK